MRNAYNLVKKALLPKIKYHWDQGFKQVEGVLPGRALSLLTPGSFWRLGQVSRHQTEDQVRGGGPGPPAPRPEVRPSTITSPQAIMPFPSVEGGGQCETKQVKLDAGKAKCKLRANELKAVSGAFTPPGHGAPLASWPCSSSLFLAV